MNFSLRGVSFPGALEGSISQMEAVAQMIGFKKNLGTEQSAHKQRWQSQLFSQGEPSRFKKKKYIIIIIIIIIIIGLDPERKTRGNSI